MKPCKLSRICAAAALMLGGACAASQAPDGRACKAGEGRCTDAGYAVCNSDGAWDTPASCGSSACDATLGCIECVPGSTSCDGADVVRCGEDGKRGKVEPCDHDAGLVCDQGTCSDGC